MTETISQKFDLSIGRQCGLFMPTALEPKVWKRYNRLFLAGISSFIGCAGKKDNLELFDARHAAMLNL